MTLGERMAALEAKVKGGFENLNNLIQNHFDSHDKRQQFNERLIIALIGISGTAVVGMFLLIVKYMLE